MAHTSRYADNQVIRLLSGRAWLSQTLPQELLDGLANEAQAQPRTMLARDAWRTEWAVMRWLLPLALLHGLLFLVLVPPWQHYDEPSHFAYAAQIAAGERERPGPQAVTINREIADSMYRHGFYQPGERPNLLGAAAVDLGANQRVHPPFYYTLVAGPLSVLRYLPVEQQLYAARTLSLGFYALSVLAAWRVAVTILPDEPLMQLVIPLLLLLAPSFADIMTAVNNDVLVNFAAMAMLLGCALLIRHGPQPTALALTLLGLTVALLTKRTALPLLAPAALALLWAWRRRPLPWTLVAPTALLALLALAGAALRFERVAGELRLLPRAWLVALDQAYLRLQIEPWLLSLEDWQRSAALYPQVISILFDSFWARLGWGNIDLGVVTDLLVRLVVAAAAMGLLARAWQNRGLLPLWQHRFIWLLLLMVSLAWTASILRIHPLPSSPQLLYFPRGRYMFWAMLPHLWLLALGWQGLFPARWRPATPLVLLALFVALSMLSWAVVLTGFYA
jgi:hypothetical protein